MKPARGRERGRGDMHPKIRQSAAEFESVYVTADGAPRVLDCRNQNIPRLCTLAYGFLFGFGLGWLPAFFLALLVGGATVILWGPAVVLLLLFAVANLLG
jgi:hypothetical protein